VQRSAPRRRRDDRDDEEEETTQAPATRRRRDEDDEDDQDAGGKSSSTILWLVGGLAGLAAAGVIAFLVLSKPADTTEKKEQEQVRNSNGGGNQNGHINPDKDKKEEKKEEDENKEENNEGAKAVAPKPQEIYQHVLKSTAWVVNYVSRTSMATGTGSVVDMKNRLVLTNYHVVANNRLGFKVLFPTYDQGTLVTEKDKYKSRLDTEGIPATVLFQDTRRDLAVIQLTRLPEGLQALTLARKSVIPGEQVISVGNTGASDGMWGNVSGTVRQVYKKKWLAGGLNLILNLEAKVVETQSPSNPGDSGGPLVNSTGELVGVTQGGSTQGTLLSYFIDVSEATDVIEQACKGANLVWNRENRPLVVKKTANLPNLIKRLEDPNPKRRAKAAQDLADLGPAARIAVSSLVKVLKDTDETARRLARQALSNIGAPEKTDVTMLRDALKDTNLEVRIYASEALGLIGPNAQSAASALLDVLKDSDPQVRQNAARSLGQIDADAQTALPALKEVLKDADVGVRTAAAEALTTSRSLAGANVPVLLEILKHRDAKARALAARALGLLGSSAKPAIDSLIKASEPAEDIRVRRAAIISLGQFGTDAKKAVPAFIEAMHEPDLKEWAALGLSRMGAGAKPAVKVLADALTDDNKNARNHSLAALGNLGPAAKDAVPSMAHLLESEKDKRIRLLVLDVLLKVGKEAKEAIPQLIKLFEEYKEEDNKKPPPAKLKIADKELYPKVAEVLGKIGKPAVQLLLDALRNSDLTDPVKAALVRLGAATALGNIGPDAKVAAPTLLLHAQKDPVPEVKVAAAVAWRKVIAKKKATGGGRY
jgi:HEAT repeat protein